MTQLGVWLSALLPYEMAAAVLRQVGGLDLPASSLWRYTQKWGAKLEAASHRVRVAANAAPALWERPLQQQGQSERAGQRMGVGMDGAILNIRSEGWKELKFACLFDVAVRTEEDPVTHEVLPMGHAVNSTCVTHLGGPERLGELAWAEAQRRGWEAASATTIIADGAPWIWNQAELHFGDSVQVVDWYHAQSHLCAAARLVHAEGSVAGQRWLKARTTALYQGHADRIAQELRTLALTRPTQGDSLKQAAGYFQVNAHRMNYLEQREALWPIGSGVVESCAKQLKHRLCGPGMRWSRRGAALMATLRAAVLSHRFNQLWKCATAPPPN